MFVVAAVLSYGRRPVVQPDQFTDLIVGEPLARLFALLDEIVERRLVRVIRNSRADDRAACGLQVAVDDIAEDGR